MRPNPHTHGTISWARIHVVNAPEGCKQATNCPDCAYAQRVIAAALEADKRVITPPTADTTTNLPPPRKM